MVTSEVNYTIAVFPVIVHPVNSLIVLILLVLLCEYAMGISIHGVDRCVCQVNVP